MTRFAKLLAQQRRIRLLFTGLLLYSLIIALVIVPIESSAPNATIHTPFDGLRWAVATVTGIGYSESYAVSTLGGILEISLQIIGIVAFGMLVGMVTMVMNDHTNRYYYRKLFERLDTLEKQLGRIEKQNEFLIKDVTPLQIHEHNYHE